ncbi:MAG: hypothetical protein H0V17_17675 [Deltaproteobacteria bacterium]|nr:hypothetical protein [Deltaproteobacteria bacterium]
MGFGIDRRARSKRPKAGLRALLGRAPDGKEVGERLVRLARRVFKGAVIDATPKRITLGLHSYAAPVRLVVLADGDLELHAETSSVGPGYHTDVLARLAPIFEELEYTLEGETDDAKASFASWLADELRGGATKIGMPADRSFKLDAAVQTSMGPRDRAWRDAVLADPMHGSDAFAWWSRGSGREALSRALLAMWLDVPWREPLDKAERTLMETVDEQLTAARAANPKLPLPFAEWSELLEWLGADDDHTRTIQGLVGSTPVPEMLIGYRRHMMEIELTGGWTIDLGGAYVGKWEDDGASWWATDGDRVVELTSLTADGETDSQHLLDIAPSINPIIDRIEEPTRRGRAEAYDEGHVHVIHGLVTSAPHIAILTLKGRKSDEAWALSTWRSLRNG